jgi:ribonuclease HI
LTCNEAEYTTLIFGLEIALKLGIVRIKVQGDSKLVCS